MFLKGRSSLGAVPWANDWNMLPQHQHRFARRQRFPGLGLEGEAGGAACFMDALEWLPASLNFQNAISGRASVGFPELCERQCDFVSERSTQCCSGSPATGDRAGHRQLCGLVGRPLA